MSFVKLCEQAHVSYPSGSAGLRCRLVTEAGVVSEQMLAPSRTDPLLDMHSVGVNPSSGACDPPNRIAPRSEARIKRGIQTGCKTAGENIKWHALRITGKLTAEKF